MQITGSFEFHKVGQGLFYSGILNRHDKSRNDIFTFVYDCGSTSPRYFLNQEIDEFKQLLPSGHKKIDLLVVSHLHDDHVNGLQRLLNGLKVSTVVMPYVSKELRTLARIESGLDDEFLLTFYTDPIGWFAEQGVERVLLIGSSEENTGSNIIVSNEYDDLTISNRCIIGRERYDNTIIGHLKNSASLRSTVFDWEFEFENLNLGQTTNMYHESIEKFLRYNSMTLEEVFRSKKLIQELRNHINRSCPEAKNHQNRTSVVMAHFKESDTELFFSDNYYKGKHYGRNHSTLLTGDIEFYEDDHLNILNNNCLVFQYPHHGSYNNKIENLHYSVSVIPYGITNRYGHPSYEAIRSSHYPIHITERQSFNYQIIASDEGIEYYE